MSALAFFVLPPSTACQHDRARLSLPKFLQQPITLTFDDHEPLHIRVQVCPREDGFAGTPRQPLKLDENLFRSHFQQSDFIFEFAHAHLKRSPRP